MKTEDIKQQAVRSLRDVFPSMEMTPKLADLWADVFSRNPSDVVEAVIRSHKMDRRSSEPCMATVKRMLDDARNQMTGRAQVDTSQEHQSVQAVRAWAMQVIGPHCRDWSPRRIVEDRIRAEWNAIPFKVRPKPGEEINSALWVSMVVVAGGTAEDGQRFVENLTGCHQTTKYDGMDDREMFAAYRASIANLEKSKTPHPEATNA